MNTFLLSISSFIGLYRYSMKSWIGLLYFPLFFNAVVFIFGPIEIVQVIGYLLFLIFLSLWGSDIYHIYQQKYKPNAQIKVVQAIGHVLHSLYVYTGGTQRYSSPPGDDTDRFLFFILLFLLTLTSLFLLMYLSFTLIPELSSDSWIFNMSA